MDMCVVCGKQCGSLKGITKSWRCAGVLSRSTPFWEEARTRYDNPGKRKARSIPLRILERLPKGARYLELSGGGRSAEMARELRPDIEIVSADKDAKLWPALRSHAHQVGYTPLCASFTRASGTFDLIFLDLTGNSSETSMRLVRAATKMLTHNGWLIVTITPDHELDSAVSLNRPVTVTSLLMAETEMQAVGVLVYLNTESKRVTICVFRGSAKSLDPVALNRAIKKRTLFPFWSRPTYGFMFGSPWQRYRSTPEARKKHRDVVAKRNLRPDVKAKKSAWHKAYTSTPEYKAKAAARQRELRRLNPERYRGYDRSKYQRKLAAVSGTTAEAID